MEKENAKWAMCCDFPERQLPCSGERDLRTVMQE